MQNIQTQSENLLLSYLQNSPVSIAEMIFIQTHREEYRHNDEVMSAESLTLDCRFNPVRNFFSERAAIISKIAIKSSELNLAVKNMKEVEHFNIENEKLTYSDKLKVKVLLSASMEKLIPMIEYLVSNMESEEVKALESTIKENKSLNAIMRYYGTLTHCSLGSKDVVLLGKELDENSDIHEYRDGCKKLYSQLKVIYDKVNCSTVH